MSKLEAVREARAYQLHLGEKLPEIVYRFNQGIVIYPLHSGRGVLQEQVIAKKTQMKKGKSIIYESSTRLDLYFNHRFWSLPERTLFEANSKKRHEVKISAD